MIHKGNKHYPRPRRRPAEDEDEGTGAEDQTKDWGKGLHLPQAQVLDAWQKLWLLID